MGLYAFSSVMCGEIMFVVLSWVLGSLECNACGEKLVINQGNNKPSQVQYMLRTL
jgi:hypothetical protein